MVPQAFAALDEAEITDHAVIAATHASESCSPKLIAHTRQHPHSMHYLVIPSNLDVHESSASLRRSQEILLDQRDAVVAQDVVGGGELKKSCGAVKVSS